MMNNFFNGFTVFIVLEHLSKAGNVFKFYKF